MTKKAKTKKVLKKIDLRKLEPRLKHEKILKDMVDKGGNITSGGKELGYSEAYLKSGKLQKTKSWQTLINERLSDERLSRVHSELLEAGGIAHYLFPKSKDDKEIREVIAEFGFKTMKIVSDGQGKRAYYSVPDNRARVKALDMAYELKKKYGDFTVKHKFDGLTKEEAIDAILGRIGRVR